MESGTYCRSQRHSTCTVKENVFSRVLVSITVLLTHVLNFWMLCPKTMQVESVDALLNCWASLWSVGIKGCGF